MSRLLKSLLLVAGLWIPLVAIAPTPVDAYGVEKQRGKKVPALRLEISYADWSEATSTVDTYSQWRSSGTARWRYYEARVRLNGGPWISRRVTRSNSSTYVVRAKSSTKGDVWEHQVRLVNGKGSPITAWYSQVLRPNYGE